MGWAKYHEDIGDAITDAKYLSRVFKYEIESVDPPCYNCMYCNLSFNSKNDLYEHIRNEHSIVSAMLIVNGRVVHSECYVKDLKTLIAVRYDLNDSIFINHKKIEVDSDMNEIDIINNVHDSLLRDKSISIIIGSREFIIRLVSREHINVNKISSVVRQWNLETAKGIYIRKDFSEYNEIEKLCLSGLYNYFIACISTGENKCSRYNDAYAILSEVVDILPIAKVLLKIIAFKYNWIEKLRSLCNGHDSFSVVYEFMTNQKSILQKSQQEECEIYIEDNLEEILMSMIRFQNQEYKSVESFVSKYPISSVKDIDDQNDKDKICLLCARMAARKLNKHDARRYYDEIITPFFDKEKKNYIKSM